MTTDPESGLDGEIHTEPKFDDIWNLAEIGARLNVPQRQLYEWARRRSSTGFPMPQHTVGRYHLYSYQEVADWYILWQKATSNMGRGAALNGIREEGRDGGGLD